MEENLPNGEANYKALEKLMVEPENKKCADCTGSSEDGYLSLDYGTFICFYCAEIHRTLKHRVKKVAANNVRDEDLALMKSNGNRKSYDQWLVRYKGDYPEPDGASRDRTKRTEYLHLKYEEKKWARPEAAPIPPSSQSSSAEETSMTRSRSASSPPAFTPGVANPFTTNYYGPSPSEVHMIHQQQLQHQLLANQQHLQQQQIHQQMLQQQLHQNQHMLQQQYLQQQQQQQYLQQSQQQQQYVQQQQQPSQQQHSPPKNHLTQSLTQQVPETRNRSPSLTNSLPPSYTYASPPPVAIPPVLSPRGVSPMPNGTSSPAPVSPTNVTSPTASGGMVGGRTRSNSKIGVCPQCGAGVDSREMGKHKIKECPYRSTAVQGV